MDIFCISDLHVDHYLGSKTSVPKVKQLLEPHLMPADVLVVAGDIADYASVAATTLEALSQMYKDVVWVEGNHDRACWNPSDTSSQAKIDRLVAKVQAPNAHYLPSGPVTSIGGIGFGGAMGQCDFSYATRNFNMTVDEVSQKWKASWYDGKHWRIGDQGPLDIFKWQYSLLNSSIDHGAQVMVSHFGPIAHDIPKKWNNWMTGYFYFDGQDLFDRMPENGVWVFGHTHDHIKADIGGRLLVCNPFGYPDEIRGKSSIPKSEFLLKV